tara:strand:- start:4601 stop:5896 length:1296 start_codon:yes stop_codon:yes gene_type:complete
LIKQNKSVSFITYGCKVNQFDTDKIISNLPNNFSVIDDISSSDICIINTCTVTDNTDNQFFKDLRRIKRINPKIKTLVTGCLAQTSPEKLRVIDEIDLIVDNANKYLIPKVIKEPDKYNKEIISNIFDIKDFDDNYDDLKEDRSRAFLKVQDGCNFRCSFCIIPYARGKSRSMTPRNVISRINSLHEKGFNEIVLTGIHLSSYGKDISSSLIDLLRFIEKETDIPNVRISSIDPADTGFDLISFIGSSKKICPSFHISLQSATNQVLKNMRRRYKIEDFDKLIRFIRLNIPESCIGTDVIVGFPEESSENFNETLNYIKSSELNYLHVFPYSDRKGTKASISKNKVSESEKQNRSKILRKISLDLKIKFANNFIGKELDGIQEKNNKVRTNNYIEVLVESSSYSAGDIAKVLITDIKKDKAYGRIIHPHFQ